MISGILPKGTVLNGIYRIGDMIGKGGFGITYHGRDLRDGRKVAVKEYFPTALAVREQNEENSYEVRVYETGMEEEYQKGLARFRREAQNLLQFANVPGVVSVLDYFCENGTAYLVMEYVEGITLQAYLRFRGGSVSEEEILRIMKPVIGALETMHRAGVIHRDISPDNIMLSFSEDTGSSIGKTKRWQLERVTLIDFGTARMAQEGEHRKNTIVLKHGYAPEEQYRVYGEIGPWTDVYAVCATMYRAVFGKRPEDAIDRLNEGNTQSEQKGDEPSRAAVSRHMRETLKKGLAVRWQDRTSSASELYREFYGKKTPGNRKITAVPGTLVFGLFLLIAMSFLKSAGQAHIHDLQQESTGYIQILGNRTRYLESGEALLLQVDSNLEDLQISCDHPKVKAFWDDRNRRSLKIEVGNDLKDGENACVTISNSSGTIHENMILYIGTEGLMNESI